MNRITNLFLLTLITLFTLACTSDADTNENSDDNSNGINITIEDDDGEKNSINIDLDDVDLSEAEGKLEEAFGALEKAFTEGGDSDSEKVESMNFRDIKAILPSKLLGMERTSHTGEKNGIMGITISQAKAKYKEDDKSLEIDVVDSANMGIAKLGGMAWTAIEIDKETDNGYERTTEIEGYKAFEKWDSKRGKAELIWMYKDRYIITIKGYGLDADDLDKARRNIDYDDLD